MLKLTKILVLGFLVASPAFAVTSSISADEQTIEMQASGGDDGCATGGGAWICTSTGEAWDYDAVQCHTGNPSKPKAKGLCNAHCATACKDTGWN